MGILSKLFGPTEEKKFFEQGKEEATTPTVRLVNPKTGLVVYPKLEKGTDGKWHISNPDAIRALLGDRSAGEAAIWAGLEIASDAFAASPELRAIQEKAQARGLREVIAVADAPFASALVPEKDSGNTLVISEKIGRGTHAQLAGHAFFHLDVRAENPKAMRLVDAVDTSSEAFKSYRDTVNRLRDKAGLAPLTERGMAVGLAADFASGLTIVRVDGSELEEMAAKINSQIFPNGDADVNHHAIVIYGLFNEKLSIDDCKFIVKAIKALIFIASDKTANRIVPSIIIRSGNKVNSEEAYQAYLYLSGGGLSYSGGNGMS